MEKNREQILNYLEVLYYTMKKGKFENRLTFIEKTNNKDRYGAYLGLYKCKCGNIKEIRILDVGRKTKSCGCLIKEIGVLRSKHNMTKTPEYTAWSDMKRRCYNTNFEEYKNYGERGITVCDRWLESFRNFYEDIGPRPSKLHSLERKNNDLNYEPSNCCWAIDEEQNSNKRTNVYLEYDGKKLTISQWSKIKNIIPNTIKGRIKRGWTTEQALNIPTSNHKQVCPRRGK